MILCDYCRRVAARRVHVDGLASESWPALGDPNDFDQIADRYRRLSVSRYACWDHLAAAYEHVVGRVDPGVPVVLDAEL